MTMKNYQIKNEESIVTGGYVRSLVIDPDTNHPRPVWRSDRSNGNHPNAGTYQQAKDGDIVIVVTIEPDAEVKVKLNFNKVVDGDGVAVDSDFNFHPIINSITTLVREWLYESNSQPFLPKGVGWDGENPEIEKIKLEKAMSVLPKGIPMEHLQTITAAISFTSISVFNDVVIKTEPWEEELDIPDCHIYIQADKDNNFIAVEKPLFNINTGRVTIKPRKNTCKVYIIWYTTLKNNASKKIALEIIELV